MRAAFVTGGSGFIGGALIRRLVSTEILVRALARSETSARLVAALGAEPVTTGLDDVTGMTRGARGADVAFHCAARVDQWGSPEDFRSTNVTGTRNMLRACQEAGVARFVHVGTEAALLVGRPLIDVDEREPLRPDSPVPYCATKARAEMSVLAASTDGFETVVVRPRLVWGPGDSTILPNLIASVRAGRFAWVGGGRHWTATTHVDNVVEGLMLAAARGRAAQAYFVTDGDPIVFREFVTQLLATAGVEAPSRSIPAPLGRVLAAVGELAWTWLPLRGTPPVTRLAYWLSSLETTIDISRARTELGYDPIVTREAGFAALRHQEYE